MFRDGSTLCHAPKHIHSDDDDPCELPTPCVFDAMAAHCAMHPSIIIQMITTPCRLQAPCVHDAMAAHCAMHTHVIIQTITTPYELHTPCVIDTMAAHCAMHPHRTVRRLQHHASYHFMCFRCHGSPLCHASRHNHSIDYSTMRATNSMCF